MELQRNNQVRQYVSSLFCIEDEDLIFARENSKKEGLKEIQVPENVGKILHLLTKLQNPRKVLEIGTLGGYSTLWIAKALQPEAKILTLEIGEKQAEEARRHFQRASLAHQIEVRLGDALKLLPEMLAKKEGPFDLIFIDADKENYPRYLDHAIELSRSGTLILSDNLIPKRGEIGIPDPSDVEAIAIYEFNQKMRLHPRLDSTLLTTIVGERGRVDSLGIAIVKPSAPSAWPL